MAEGSTDRVAWTEEDLVLAVTADHELADGLPLPLPAALAGLPPARLRAINGRIVDGALITAWWIDACGRKRIAPGEDRQPLACGIDDPLYRRADNTWAVGGPPFAMVDGEFVTAVATGDVVGLPLPPALADGPLDLLRVIDGVVVDCADRTAWWIDAAGRKHIAPGDGRQPLTCAAAAPLHRGFDGAWAVGAPLPASVPFGQFLRGLLADGMITVAEAIAAGGTRAVPVSVQAMFDALDPPTRDQAMLMWATASVVEPSHPIIRAMVTAAGKTPAEEDAFWRTTAAA